MTVAIHLGLLPNRPVNDCMAIAEAAESLGYAGVWIADSQSVFRDAYTVLSACAVRTRRIRLAAGVTNPVTRHPAVLAGCWASLDELSDGRAILGIGVGESAVHTLGLRPARLAELEHVIGVIRHLIRGESAEHDGHTLRMPWSQREVPVFIACSGPRSLQLAGRIADGVLFQAGAAPELVRYALDNIRTGAEQAGRRLADVRVYCRLACAVDADRDRAREAIKGYAAVAAGTLYKTVPRAYFPAPLWRDLERMKSGYDYLEHGSDEARHRSLLTDRILDAVAVAGTPAEVIPRLETLAGLGVEAFVCPLAMADPIPFMQTLAREVMPYFGTHA
ncbi:MAG: LLM class flavin-dependent oxidoreductase [Gammaproteobacteria bacterium]|nr:LLM class flavin-dependent oxidoreductase [Gammaproteobacteria bacterium]